VERWNSGDEDGGGVPGAFKRDVRIQRFAERGVETAGVERCRELYADWEDVVGGD